MASGMLYIFPSVREHEKFVFEVKKTFDWPCILICIQPLLMILSTKHKL